MQGACCFFWNVRRAEFTERVGVSHGKAPLADGRRQKGREGNVEKEIGLLPHSRGVLRREETRERVGPRVLGAGHVECPKLEVEDS